MSPFVRPPRREQHGEPREGRVIYVSNRLPVSVRATRGKVDVVPSSGGLASGLSSAHAQGDSLWIGWPGDFSDAGPEARREMDARLAQLRAVPVHLSRAEIDRYYEGFCNGVLWPLLHYLIERVPQHARNWETYVRVNERFADAVAAHATPKDRIWIHDYQLMLLPALVRKRIPQARIGFFLHVPFPSSEVFRTLPWREQILTGLLGADLIGFHTFEYLRHFTNSILRILGVESEVDRLTHEGRVIRLGAFPMGIDSALFSQLADDAEVLDEMRKIRESAGGAKLLLGVDRLDYTKGLRRRLLAVERLLSREPALRGKIRFLQLAVPSREHTDEYRAFRREIEELVGRINGTHATVYGSPLSYMYRSVSQRQLVAMYRATDVMVVTPLRDGMNLVCKEFVASRTDGDGVLVLSEMAGAASELGEALIINPYDVDKTATALAQALSMPEHERRERMAAMRQRVLGRTVQDWASTFLTALTAGPPPPTAIDLRERPSAILAMAEELANAEHLALLIDYDGTLVPLVKRPELAVPDRTLLPLLRELAALPRTSVNVVSGRTRESLEGWLGDLPVTLYAEHGLLVRECPSAAWRFLAEVDGAYKERIRPVLEEFAARTPGAVVEEKTVGMTWHYRAADAELGLLQAKELRLYLVQILAQVPVEILLGEKILEVRPHGATKALAANDVATRLGPSVVIAAFGDDRTDEDMFGALPPSAVSIHVGGRPTRATHRVDGPEEVRALLRAIVEKRGAAVKA